MSEWKIRFGTAGTSDSFTAMGYKNSLDIPAYTEKMGLDAFEYQCGHGVRLGLDKARQFHVHFSRIEYSKGGEKRHWTFAETQFGPEPQPLMELLAERGLAPVIICESAGTQAEDAKTMKRFFEACLCTTSQSGLRPPAPLVGEPLA